MRYFLVVIIILFIYLPWFQFSKTLSSGDWPYLFVENIQAFKIPTDLPFLWLEPYYQLTAKLGVQFFSLPWEAAEKIFWFFPFLVISLVSSYFFLKYLAYKFEIDGKESTIFISLGKIIFTANTYILMLVGGGQMGVAIAYSMIPLVFLFFLKLIDSNSSSSLNSKFKIQNSKLYIFAILALGTQLMFDPRIFLLSVFIAALYILFRYKEFNVKILKRILVVLVLTIATNLFWILPNFGYFNTEYKSAIDAANADFLSFATFSNSISLLHPNWPENIFGKIGFMKPEFILIPIIAFSSLILGNSTMKQFNNRIVLFFAFLGILGAFFAKGTNPPFGELYGWLSNFPGFSVFRDPTKFYILIAVSYMVLIPLSLYKLSEKVSSIKYPPFAKALAGRQVLSIVFMAFWLITIHPAMLGNLTGTFKPHDVPKEYISLKNFLYSQTAFTKTLWVPQIERFGFNSRTIPAISSMELFGVSSVSEVLDKFNTLETKKQLIDEEVKYIIIPYDYLKELFLTERKYDEKLYTATINKLGKVNWLSEMESKSFGKIKVFKLLD